MSEHSASDPSGTRPQKVPEHVVEIYRSAWTAFMRAQQYLEQFKKLAIDDPQRAITIELTEQLLQRVDDVFQGRAEPSTLQQHTPSGSVIPYYGWRVLYEMAETMYRNVASAFLYGHVVKDSAFEVLAAQGSFALAHQQDLASLGRRPPVNAETTASPTFSSVFPSRVLYMTPDWRKAIDDYFESIKTRE